MNTEKNLNEPTNGSEKLGAGWKWPIIIAIILGSIGTIYTIKKGTGN